MTLPSCSTASADALVDRREDVPARRSPVRPSSAGSAEWRGERDCDARNEHGQNGRDGDPARSDLGGRGRLDPLPEPSRSVGTRSGIDAKSSRYAGHAGMSSRQNEFGLDDCERREALHDQECREPPCRAVPLSRHAGLGGRRSARRTAPTGRAADSRRTRAASSSACASGRGRGRHSGRSSGRARAAPTRRRRAPARARTPEPCRARAPSTAGGRGERARSPRRMRALHASVERRHRPAPLRPRPAGSVASAPRAAPISTPASTASVLVPASASARRRAHRPAPAPSTGSPPSL